MSVLTLNGRPRAGLVYKWTEAVSLYGSYTQSLKPTSTIAPLSSGVVIDSGVLPEQATSWELGTKLDLPGSMTGSLAFFNIDKKNVLVSQYNDVTRQTDWRTSGRASARGRRCASRSAGSRRCTGRPARSSCRC